MWTRRELVIGAAAAATVAGAGRSESAAEPTAAAARPAPGPHPARHHPELLQAALECAGAGYACTDHCFDAFKSGDTTLADCAASVDQMIPVCEALAKLASSDSQRLPAYARVCADVCADCEKLCRKHEAHHEVCKACADACQRVVEECGKVGLSRPLDTAR